MATPVGSYGAKASIGTSAVALAASTPVRTGVVVQALAVNTGTVYVGNDASVTNANGFPLAAGSSQSFDVGFIGGDLANLYLYGSASGQEVRYWYV